MLINAEICSVHYLKAVNIYNHCALISYLCDDASKFENNSRIDMCEAYSNGGRAADYTALSLNSGRYVDYNGKLYRKSDVSKRFTYSTALVVTKKSDKIISVTRRIEWVYGDEKISSLSDEREFTFVLEKDEWKLRNISSSDEKRNKMQT